MNQRFRFCLLALLALPVLAAARPDAVDACAECHGADGMGTGDPMIPVLAGIPAGHIEEAVFAYIDGARRCVREPKMCETVAELDEDTVFDIANYYGAKERQALNQPYDEKLAEEGAALHRQHCAACHMRPDSEEAEYAIGIPLHGQRKEYLRYAIEAYLAGDREALLPAMAHELGELEAGDIGAVVNYYASYRPADAAD
ncbi:c-type cytochrome [Lentisalinibacter salinarum]|uniref:c-type cytochrome n=1 Tax=Lentisalinibacter salinarum TaxID=2992239 RepID=UPI00386DCEA0